jgi:hypothetical protein
LFELLVSGDAVVPDHDVAIARCQEEWGLPPVHPNWTVAPPGAGAKYSFARIQRDRHQAPTALEILGIPYQAGESDPNQAGHAYLPDIAASQGDRPVRNHSTVVSALDVRAVAGQLAVAGGRFRLDEPDANLPFPRLWIGYSERHPGEYDPTTDGGLRLEVIPHQSLLMPDPHTASVRVRLDAGAPVRMVARTLVVADLDATLGALESNLGWRPETVADSEDGIRRARFGFSYPRSALLEVAQPDGPASVEGEFLAEWGPGPFSVRIAVNGIGSLQRRFLTGDVPHQMLPPAEAGETARLYRPPERALGTAFEFIESP